MPHLILTVLCAIFIGKTLSDDVTPFCKFCACTNTPNNRDVNCSSSIIRSALYNKELWFNKATNGSYNISSLSLQNTDLTVLNETFPGTNLKVLDLSFNRITNISDGVFVNFEDMEELILSNNRLQTIGPDVFRGLRLEGYDYPLRSLRILRLDHNELHTLHPDVFQHVDREIKVLSLSHNPFKVFDQQTIIAITSIVMLEELDISYTQLKDLPQYFLHTPQYLKKLDLSGNQLTRIPETLEDAHVLEELIMDNNPIANLTKEAGFPVVQTLKKLRLCDMSDLQEIGAHSMSGLENLEELYIEYNNALTTINVNALLRWDTENPVWPRIKKLSIKNNRLTHFDSAFLANWDYLVALDLRGNPWTCECENQWMVEELMPIYVGINVTQAREIKCAAPIEMEDKTMYDIYQAKSVMRCLDLYGNRPERDGTILIGILIGILLSIPAILFILYAYQRNWFGCFDNSPAAYSRQFYRAPSLGDDAHL